MHQKSLQLQYVEELVNNIKRARLTIMLLIARLYVAYESLLAVLVRFKR